jgi:2-polyprenyl-3-methyl-5-hydroxy-6-metoxy-1,4-benzoquinol methylase
MNKCPICQSSDFSKKLMNIQKFPIINTPIRLDQKKKLSKNFLNKDLFFNLNILICKNCFHTYLKKTPDKNKLNKLYSNYYSHPSPLLENFNPNRDLEFIKFIKDNKNILSKKKIKKILEIGCYDGFVLFNLKKMGFKVTGCEPSKGALIGKKFGLNIYKKFFNSNFFLKKKMGFDFVFSRHFLEHINSPLEILKEKIKVMNPKGLIAFEVPNIEYYLKNSLLEVFSLQHIHGFSLRSVKILLSKLGLRILKIKKTPENLIVLAEKNQKFKYVKSKYYLTDYSKKIFSTKKSINKEIKNYQNKKKKIIFWGAGGFSIAANFLYGINEKLISYIVDSDKKKLKMGFAHNSLRIYDPSKIYIDKPDLIVITSYYSKEIIKTIKKMNLNINVLRIFPKTKLFNF